MFGKVSKLFRYVLYFILFCVLLCACGVITLHDHEWQEATCAAAKTCSICGDTKDDPLEHQWVDATCTEPKTCTVCGETKGYPYYHKWVKATCAEAKTCSVCGETDGEPLGHYPSFFRSERQIIKVATCQTEGIEAYPCVRCGVLVESTFPKSSHSLSDWQVVQEATVDSGGTEARYCTVCGAEAESRETPKKVEHSISGNGGGNGNKTTGTGGNNFNTHNNESQQQTTASYVLNTSTMKFHRPSCRDVPRIATQNYATSSQSRADLISRGYSSCGHCNP